MNYEATPEQWAAVAECVRERRENLGLTQAEAVTRSDGTVGMSTWSHLERGDKASYQQTKLKAVCRVLGWSLDSISRIAAGKEPLVVGDGASEPDAEVRLKSREAAGRETVREIEAVLAASQEIQAQILEIRAVVRALLARVESLEEQAGP